MSERLPNYSLNLNPKVTFAILLVDRTRVTGNCIDCLELAKGYVSDLIDSPFFPLAVREIAVGIRHPPLPIPRSTSQCRQYLKGAVQAASYRRRYANGAIH